MSKLIEKVGRVHRKVYYGMILLVTFNYFVRSAFVAEIYFHYPMLYLALTD